MADQPIPSVSRADVERIVRRDYPPEMFDEILRILDGYGEGGRAPSDKARVHLAALKLANGNRRVLSERVKEANIDFRDVLASAEYPHYMRRVPGPGQPPGVDEIIERDWQQYQTWLNR